MYYVCFSRLYRFFKVVELNRIFTYKLAYFNFHQSVSTRLNLIATVIKV